MVESMRDHERRLGQLNDLLRDTLDAPDRQAIRQQIAELKLKIAAERDKDLLALFTVCVVNAVMLLTLTAHLLMR